MKLTLLILFTFLLCACKRETDIIPTAPEIIAPEKTFIGNYNTEWTAYTPNITNWNTANKCFTTSIRGTLVTVNMPASYKAKTENKIVIFMHGHGGRATDYWRLLPNISLLEPLLNAGYIVVSHDNNPLNSWGNLDAVSDMGDLMSYLNNYINIEAKPYLIMQSMGGLVGLNAISHKTLNPKAVVGIFAVCNLADMYQTSLNSSIQTAFSISSTREYKTATAGFDPVKELPQLFSKIPMKFYHSPTDNLVNKGANPDLFASLVNAANGNVTVVSTSGYHGDPINFKPAEIVEFFGKY